MDIDIHYDDLLEVDTMGSYNHSTIQANLAYLLKGLGQYSVATELSLNVSQLNASQFDFNLRDEIKPDVCLYPKRPMKRLQDILRMSEMPLLVIEILSPRQGSYEILQKFKVYFALGIKSCWLVDPALNTVAVHASIKNFKLFDHGDIIDETLQIRLPLAEILDYVDEE